jgi:hypothetical protein
VWIPDLLPHGAPRLPGSIDLGLIHDCSTQGCSSVSQRLREAVGHTEGARFCRPRFG